MHTFAPSAGVTVIVKSPVDFCLDDVNDRVMNHAISKRSRSNLAFFPFVNSEQTIAAGSIAEVN